MFQQAFTDHYTYIQKKRYDGEGQKKIILSTPISKFHSQRTQEILNRPITTNLNRRKTFLLKVRIKTLYFDLLLIKLF